jgi:hypothetical protein
VIAELGRPAHPDSSHHKNNLSQYKIEEAEFFLEDSAALFDVSLEFSEWGR